MMELRSIENDEVIAQFVDLPDEVLSSEQVAELVDSNTDTIEHILQDYFGRGVLSLVGTYYKGYGFYRLNKENKEAQKLIEYNKFITLYNSSSPS